MSNEQNPDVYKARFNKNKEKNHEILKRIWRISRIVLYLLSVSTFLYYFWNFLGLLFGITIFTFSKEKSWRLHGLILAISIGVGSWLLNNARMLWGALMLVILLVYIAVSIVIVIIREIISLLRKKNLAKKPSKEIKINQKLMLVAKLAAIIAPILIWSSVNINFEVMFNNRTQMLWIHVPSMGEIGEELELTVEAWDEFERLSASYRGTVKFSIQSNNLTTGIIIPSPLATLPEAYTFTGNIFSDGIVPAYELGDKKDFGSKIFPIQINTTGIHYIMVEDSETENIYWSNPIIVDNYPEGTPKLIWGDIHGHTMISDGSGSVKHSYDYARNVAKLEFCSITDHGENLNLNGWVPAGTIDLKNYIAGTNDAYDPGKFVALQGEEWTSSYSMYFIPTQIATGGHYAMVFSGNDIPLVAGNIQANPAELWTVLDEYVTTSGEKVIATPHHTIRNQFIQDWTYLNPDYVRLAEVSSVHGECLYNNASNYVGSVDTAIHVDGSSIIEALNMGYRLTIMASGDNHDGHPGHSLSHTKAYIGHQYPFSTYNARNGHPYPSGLVALYSTELTRNAVFDELQNGRVYGNSDFGRPILKFSINGMEVKYNSTIIVSALTADRNISIFLAQDGSPAASFKTAASINANWSPKWEVTIEIIKNGAVWKNYSINSPISNIFFTDNDPIIGATYENYYTDSEGKSYINDQSANPVNPATLNTKGVDYYAVRVVGNNGRMSFIGPIWVQIQ